MTELPSYISTMVLSLIQLPKIQEMDVGWRVVNSLRDQDLFAFILELRGKLYFSHRVVFQVDVSP